MAACQWCGGEDAAGTCPKSLECPSCHAAPGSSCKRPSGHRASRLHAERVAAAERADRDALALPQLDLDGGETRLEAPTDTAPAQLTFEQPRLFQPQLEGQLGLLD